MFVILNPKIHDLNINENNKKLANSALIFK